jgi:hypothetical protein
VTLSISGLPAGVSAAIDPNSVPSGEHATLTLTTAATPLGEYELLVEGDAGSKVHERPFGLAVVEQVVDMILPLIAR